MTAYELLRELVDRFNRSGRGPQDAQATVQVVVHGEGGGHWVVRLERGQASLEQGPTERWDVAIEVSAEDLVALARGELSPVAAYLAGRLRVQGNLGLLMRLQPLLS